MTTQAASEAVDVPPPVTPAMLDSVRPADKVLRVSSSSSPQALASAIAHGIYERQDVVLRTIGVGATGQAMKACAIARGFVAPRGIDLSVRPGFEEVQGSRGDDVTAMTFRILVD